MPASQNTQTRIAFGGAALSGEGGGYGFGKMSEEEAQRLLLHAWERGVRIFDTAPIYGFGVSEERMGKFLPQEAFIVSKGGVDWHPNNRVNMSNAPAIMEKMINQSLKRLKRDCIPVYMIHWPDPKIDIRAPMEVLKKFQDQGKIGELGLCNTTPDDLSKAEEIASISYLQSEVNLFQANRLDELACENYKTMSWGTFDKGILTGRVSEGRVFEKEDCRSWAPWWNRKEVQQKVKRVQELKTLLSEQSLSLKHFALQFNLELKNVSYALVGPKSPEDLDEVLDLAQIKIPASTLSAIYKKWQEGAQA